MNDETISFLGDGTYRAHWLRTIIKTPQVTDSIRVLLMTLALHMDASGRVSVPREDIAALLGRNSRKVGEKVKVALEAGFLVQTARGQKHQTAVYRAAIGGQVLSMSPEGPAESPDLRMSPGGPAENSQGADFYDPEPNSQGADFYDPETQGADLSMSPEGPAEDSQVAPRGAPQSFIRVEVVEEVDLSGGSLFGVEPAASQRPASKSKPKRSTTEPPRVDVERLCSRLAELMLANGYLKRDAKVSDSWRDAARKLFDLDKIPLDEALRVLEWSQADRFWRKNVRSMSTFRDKYSRLRIESNESSSSGARSTGTDGRPSNGSGPHIDRNIPYPTDIKDL